MTSRHPPPRARRRGARAGFASSRSSPTRLARAHREGRGRRRARGADRARSRRRGDRARTRRRQRRVTQETVVEALGRARYAYDKGGEEHYNLASALIKSLRNSDANAGLYWLARLIEGGADPVFIARRLCILASEDVGLADPQAMVQAAAAAQITQLIGLPEALYPLSQATVYLARAPKSNAIKRAYMAAAEDAAETAREPVPLHLRNAVTPLMKRQGYGKGYRYVHDDAAASREMDCLPDGLRGRKYWEEEP